MNIIAISPKSGMEQAEIIDTFWKYHVLLLTSSYYVAIVRIHSTTLGSSSRLLLRLLLGLVLLPRGIPGKMIIPLDTFTTIAMLSCLDAIVTCRATHLLCQPLLVAMKPLTF